MQAQTPIGIKPPRNLIPPDRMELQEFGILDLALRLGLDECCLLDVRAVLGIECLEQGAIRDAEGGDGAGEGCRIGEAGVGSGSRGEVGDPGKGGRHG